MHGYKWPINCTRTRTGTGLVNTIAIAAQYTATHPQGKVEVRLGLGTYYKLRETVVLPERTQLIGEGADGQTIIEFDLVPPSPPGPPPICRCVYNYSATYNHA